MALVVLQLCIMYWMTYRALSDIEHVLLRSETYGGPTTDERWDVNIDGKTESLVVVPMLYKVFDEAITNAADCAARGGRKTTKHIDITVGLDSVTVYNDGKTVPLKKHVDPRSGKSILTPELVFFRMRAGQNFEDGEQRYEGGRNGIGIKLGSIFSTSATVTCNGKKRFEQTYTRNMRDAGVARVSSGVGPEHTQVHFELDLSRFRIGGEPLVEIPRDVRTLMRRRALDVAACCEGVAVTFNGAMLPTSFDEYCCQHLTPLCVETRKRWSVGFGLAEDGQDISFVNNVWTRQGGTHLDHVREELCKNLPLAKWGMSRRDAYRQLHIVVRCYVANPTFNSQMKERLTLPIKEFDSMFKVSSTMRKALQPVVARLAQVHAEREQKKMRKQNGKKSRKVSMLKLTNAKKAGTGQSDKCTLILTEGDSALALALAGLGVVGTDYYGAYPLKGKILNGEKASNKQWSENKVIQNVVKILGLKHGVKYSSTRTLNYGHVLIMADQDVDGFHIRGLVMCMFGSHWSELLSIPGFIQVMKTPLVKFSRGKTIVAEFFDEESAAQHALQYPSQQCKYYKGLGTSTAAEARDYFRNLDKYVFDMGGTQTPLRLAYGVDTAYRKELSAAPPSIGDGETYSTFVRGPFAQYIRSDNQRKIPAGEDGLKLVQRKILWTLLCKKYRTEQKVAQLAGIVANYSHYHSGEDNISNAIINMAQDYPGSNNLPYLTASGQFGTRNSGGKDHAAARYIYTELHPWVSKAFRQEDMAVYRFAKVDGHSVEPVTFVPIIPMVLVNGICGLGTAWVCNIPQHNPLDLIAHIRARLKGITHEAPEPWTRDHGGKYYREENKLLNAVKLRWEGNTATLTDLPVATWTETLEKRIKDPTKAPREGVDFDRCEQTNTDVSLEFVFRGVKEPTKLAQQLQLTKHIRENYVVFENQHLVQSNPQRIIEHHFQRRHELYRERKAYQVKQLRVDMEENNARHAFVQACVENRIPLMGDPVAACHQEGVDPKYLDIRIRDLSQQRVEELERSIERQGKRLATLEKKTVTETWLEELQELEEVIRHRKRKRLWTRETTH